MNPKRPGVMFMQKHWDVLLRDDAGNNWSEISGNLPTDFGFAIDVNTNYRRVSSLGREVGKPAKCLRAATMQLRKIGRPEQERRAPKEKPAYLTAENREQ